MGEIKRFIGDPEMRMCFGLSLCFADDLAGIEDARRLFFQSESWKKPVSVQEKKMTLYSSLLGGAVG